ncbi:hypothetical protein LTR37_017575 [Vermiconidia calcicola]|uniref:Uncharacterized protein n=1 Tax=Vermiconidia calcicola TaxID=1690605 RepID=A0ACC3MJP1_9PEZI|nr:hypothetical protein LTR37_017575 [Vermiconidia calcicola]
MAPAKLVVTTGRDKQDKISKPSLLTIAAELRNTIYELSLVSNGKIDLSIPSNKQQPGLLKASRQTRQEALPIYYQGNKFSYTIHGYDGVVAMPAAKLVRKHCPKAKGSLIIELHEACPVHVCKLALWLKGYHENASIPSLRQDRRAEEGDDRTLARRTFGVVQAMRSKKWHEDLAEHEESDEWDKEDDDDDDNDESDFDEEDDDTST